MRRAKQRKFNRVVKNKKNNAWLGRLKILDQNTCQSISACCYFSIRSLFSLGNEPSGNQLQSLWTCARLLCEEVQWLWSWWEAEECSPGLQNVQASLRRAPIACQLLPSLPLDQLIIQNDGLLLPQQLQCFLVLLCQVLQLERHNLKIVATVDKKKIKATCWSHLTSLYFCSVLASLVSHASTVARLLRRVGSLSCRSAGGSVARLVSWAGEGSGWCHSEGEGWRSGGDK